MNKQQTPLLSVCIITYNHAEFIREALDGVLMQNTSFAFEVVIADDCSTDNTRELLQEYKEKYPSKINLILQEPNVGPAKNWLDLIYFPESKYIAYLEGDDYWTDPHKLQKQVDFLENNEGFVMSFHAVHRLKGKELLKSPFPMPPRNVLTGSDIVLKHYIPSCSLVHRVDAFPRPLPDWFLISRIGDIPFQILIANNGLTHYSEDIMGVYRLNKDSISQSKEQIKNGRAAFIFVYKALRKYVDRKLWLPLTVKLWKTHLGYVKDLLGLNRSLK